MLVPSMNFEEIRAEVLKDYPILQRKILHEHPRIMKYLRQTKSESYVTTKNYYSKYKNTWIYRTFSTKEGTDYACCVYFFSRKGIMAITVDPKQNFLHLYTSHFLKRFNERLHLRIVKPEDLLCVYLALNHHIHYRDLETGKQDVIKIMGKSDTGIVLGYRIESLNLLKLNTFLSLDMLKNDQLELEQQLHFALDKYSGETHSFD